MNLAVAVEVVEYRVVPFRSGVRPTLRARIVEPSADVKTWRGRPREDQLKRALQSKNVGRTRRCLKDAVRGRGSGSMPTSTAQPSPRAGEGEKASTGG